MTQSIKLGLPGLSVPQGTHLCGFFRGSRERGSMMFPFVREGLRSGDKCLCAFEAPDRDALCAEVSAEADLASVGHQLDLLLSSDLYRGRNGFSVQAMLDYWDMWVRGSLSSGFSTARAVAETTCAVTTVIGAANLIRYEAELNRFVPRYPQVLLCLYDLDRCGGDLFIDIMRTHPMVLMGSTVLENLYYVPPDQLAASRSSRS
jgi:hypothetical protein